MGTISSALSIMSQALNADQAALNVVANNVANANTPGYTEETPTWRQNQPINVNGTVTGGSVDGKPAIIVKPDSGADVLLLQAKLPVAVQGMPVRTI